MLKHFLSYFRAEAALISGQAASRHVVKFTAVFQTFTSLLCHNPTIGVEKGFKIFEICSNIFFYILPLGIDRQTVRQRDEWRNNVPVIARGCTGIKAQTEQKYNMRPSETSESKAFHQICCEIGPDFPSDCSLLQSVWSAFDKIIDYIFFFFFFPNWMVNMEHFT